MTTLALPLAYWHNIPIATVTHICTENTLDAIFTAHNTGHIAKFTTIKEEGKIISFVPEFYMFGHRERISTMNICNLQADGNNSDNKVIISIAWGGDIIMWSAVDGKSLLSVSKGIHFKVTNAEVSENGKYLICCGHSCEVVVVDIKTLEVKKSFKVEDSWITCCKIFKQTIDHRIAFATLDGHLHFWTMEDGISLKRKVGYIKLVNHFEPANCIAFNIFDHDLIIVVYSDKAVVCTSAVTVKTLCEIPCPEFDPWVHASFATPKSILLRTKTGRGYHYIIADVEEEGTANQYTGLLSCIFDYESEGGANAASAYVHARMIDGSDYLLTAVNQPNDFRLLLWSFNPASLLASQSFNIKTKLNPEKDIAISNSWPKTWEKDKRRVTAITTIKEEKVVIGYDDGKIEVIPSFYFLSEYRVDPSSDMMTTFSGHRLAVTCLCISDEKLQDKCYLISGGVDCCIKIWDLINSKPLASFSIHVQPLKRLFLSPVESGRYSNCIYSVSRDNSIGVISLDEIKCLHTFSGHPSAIKTLEWRDGGNVFVVHCENNTSLTWEMKTSRIVEQHDIFIPKSDEEFSGPIKMIDVNESTISISRQVLNVIPIYTDFEEFPLLHIFSINLKKLFRCIDFPKDKDVERYQNPLTKKEEEETVDESQSFQDKEAAKNSNSPINSTSDGINSLPVKTTSDHHDRTSSTAANSVSGSKPSSVSLNMKLDPSAISYILPNLVIKSAGPIPQLPGKNKTLLDLGNKKLSFGVKSIERNQEVFTIQAPLRNESHELCVSPSLSASRLISLLTLVRLQYIIDNGQNYQEAEKQADIYASKYLSQISHTLGKSYCFPSFATLAKYWLDPSCAYSQEATRLICNETLHVMSSSNKITLIKYWYPALPASIGEKETISKNAAKSAIVLGIIGAEFPELLSHRECKDIACVLTAMINEAANSLSHQSAFSLSVLSAIELMGKGFGVWEPHINGAAIVRRLVSLITPQGSNRNIRPLQLITRNAIAHIASINMPLLISIITIDMKHTNDIHIKMVWLKLVHFLITKQPESLYDYLISLVDVVVHCLDPSELQTREKLMPATTVTLHELVRTYPSIAFHGATQRLAVGGAVDNTISVYDLRTATRLQQLMGHKQPVTALAFNNSGTMIASYSLHDNILNIWGPTRGLLQSILGGISGESSFGCNNTIKVNTTMPSGEISKMMILGNLRLLWDGDSTVKLKTLLGQTLTYKV